MVRALLWLLPGGLVSVLCAALVLGDGTAALEGSLSGWIPGVTSGAAALLGVWFHRSRVVLFGVGVGLLQWLAFQNPLGPQGLLLSGGILAGSVGVFVVVQDRGVLSMAGLLRLGIPATALGFGLLLTALAPEDIASFLALSPFPPEIFAWTGLPQPVSAAFLLALLAAVVSCSLRDGPVERGVLWSLVMVALALRFSNEPGSAAVFFTGAGVTLGLSVMETSHAMAYRDDLTGLPARRALLRDLHGLSGTYSAAMVDVDHFKGFNDRYGHDVGDQVLRMVAARLAQVGGGGRAYRFGGEEFTLLFVGKTLQEALPHLREARRSVEEASFTLRSWRRPRKKPVDPGAWRGAIPREPKVLSVTVSIGVSDASGSDPSPETVLKKADQALYRAKKAGRNRVAR